MRARSMCVLILAGCGGGGHGVEAPDGGTEPNVDAKQFMDAPPVVPGQITISGKTTERGLGGTTAVAGVTLEAFGTDDENTPRGIATSDAQGGFAITVSVTGPLDGFLKATKSGYVDIYLYPAEPFTMNFSDAAINMLTPSNKDFLNSLANGGQMAGKGMIGLQVRDANGEPVAGATVSSTPASGAYRYTGSNGLPSSSATATSSDGVAFMFNVPDGPIVVTASKSGMMFKAHAVKAPPDKFTTTSITP